VNPYPKSRLPGPAVRLFELEEAALLADPDATVRGLVAGGQTVKMHPREQQVLVNETRPKRKP